ncbi:MAG: hypothetical protein ABJH52_07190 [Henriciella sp.]
MTIEFSVTEANSVNIFDVVREVSHVITPNQMYVEEAVERAEILRFESDASVCSRLAILRTYIMPEPDGSQLVLCQHLSDRVPPIPSVTARLCPVDPSLATTEQQIANEARLAVIKHIRDDRRRRAGKG